MAELVDTHCHIQSIKSGKGEPITAELWAKANPNLGDVINGAIEHGVTRMIAVGCNTLDSRLALELAAKHPAVWASAGIHPHEARNHLDPATQQAFRELMGSSRLLAIGECGLDYYYNHSDKSDQQQLLEFQLQLALDYSLPVIFHVRDAFKDFWPIFDNFGRSGKLKGVLHSFTDNEAQLKAAIKRGLMIGVNGIATFTTKAEQTAVYKKIPIHSLLLETDAPFLTPSPIRGKINMPQNVRLVAEYMANLRQLSLDELASQTTVNARKLFRF